MAKVEWRMDLQTYEDFLNIIEELAETHPDFEYERYQELKEELQLLNNFPMDYDPEHDVVVPVLNSPRPIAVLNVSKEH